MRLLAWYLESQSEGAVAAGVRVEAIGTARPPARRAGRRHRRRPKRLPARGTKLRLRVALDYSGRDAILAAAGGASELSARESIDDWDHRWTC